MSRFVTRFLTLSISVFAAALLIAGVTQLTNAGQWNQRLVAGGGTWLFNSHNQQGSTADAGAPIVVVAFKSYKSRKEIPKSAPASTAPAAAVTRDDINYEKSKRPVYTAGAPDPRTLSVDARSAELEKIVQESRSSGGRVVEGYEHRIKVRNAANKPADILFWEYQFIETSNPENVVRRQFICGVEMKPNKEKDVQSFSFSSPSAVISVESLAKGSTKPFEERVVINRVEFTDGSIWQRKDWNFAEVRMAITRAVSTPWGAEMCRSL
jgi:hypothetical protein